MSFVLRRNAARVICFNPAGQMVMIQSTDPADPHKEPWWELPGGGIDHGESPQDACERELREEVGIADAAIGSCVFTQRAQFSFAGWDFDQQERIYLATSAGQPSVATAREAFEAVAFQQVRWWNPDEFLLDHSPTVPPRLKEFLPLVLDGSVGADGFEPVDITPVDITPID